MYGNDGYTKLLISSDTTDGDPSIVDSSIGSIAHTIYSYGANMAHSTDQAKFGASSIESVTSADYLVIANHADFDFGSGDFTIDFWIRRTVAGEENVFGIYKFESPGYSGFRFKFNSSNIAEFVYAIATDGSAVTVSGTSTNATGEWIHFAVVRFGNTIKLYRNGVEDGSVSETDSIETPTENLAIFRYSASDSTDAFNGYKDEIRVSKGIARWETGFTPETEPYSIQTGPIDDIACGIGLSPNISVYSNPISVIASLGLSSPILADQTVFQQIPVGIGLSSALVIDTKRIDSIAVGIGFSSGVTIFTDKRPVIFSEFGLYCLMSIHAQKPMNIAASIGLGSNVFVEKVPQLELVAGFLMGCSLSVANESPIDISSGIGLSEGAVIETDGATCSLPSHDSTRWS